MIVLASLIYSASLAVERGPISNLAPSAFSSKSLATVILLLVAL